MPLCPVIDRKRFLELGYTRQTWEELTRALPVIRPNGTDGRKVFLREEDVERYLAERTSPPARKAAA
jgi:hypothetical protein